MKKLLGWLLFVVVVLLTGALPSAHAAGTIITAKAVTCPASGTSIQVSAAAASRESYLLSNTAGATVRLGFLPSGTATLDDTNSIQVLAGQTFGDAAPSIFIGRLVCMSNDATPRAIYIVESRRN
jgi:hypothetical protein